MAKGIEWKCTTCAYKLRTSGIKPFYRDKENKLRLYGDPLPVSEEAERTGIKGFWVEWYCPNCKSVHEAVLLEYDEPRRDESRWAGLRHNTSRSMPVCSKCGSNLKNFLDDSDVCPKCNTGTFEIAGFWSAESVS